MAGSTLDPENTPDGRRPKKHLKGHDTKSLGPSDSSDSGSDLAAPGTDELVGDINMDDNSDRHGTGEHMGAGREPRVRINSDTGVDRTVAPEEAGLGGGLDQAEEAQQGVTDEEIERRKQRRK